MNNNEHSPTPWEEGFYWWEIRDANDAPVAQVEDVNEPVAKDNAAFIVRAVNCHADLLAACERALAWLEPFQGEEVCPKRLALAECLQTAILKTEGPTA
jgi:hypothetical protein